MPRSGMNAVNLTFPRRLFPSPLQRGFFRYFASSIEYELGSLAYALPAQSMMAVTPKRASVIIFRIIYSSSYTIFFVALLLLLAVTPGDHIYQTVSNEKLGNVFVVGGTYLVTGLIAVFIYASRLYTNRTTLAAIPKPYLPIEDGEVSKNVRKMIVKNRQRSALIALQSRPRPAAVFSAESHQDSNEKHSSHDSSRREARHKHSPKDIYVEVDPEEPPWGEITHPGWSGPNSADLSDLQFDTVVAELPNLIEARAVSLAPPDPAFDFLSGSQTHLQPPPDAAIVSQLQRSPCQGLREYLNQLQHLGVLQSRRTINSFIGQYEYARFSTHSILESEFRSLMTTFSNLLVEMVGVWPSAGSKDVQESESRESQDSSQAVSIAHGLRQGGAEIGETASLLSLNSNQSVVRHLPEEPGD